MNFWRGGNSESVWPAANAPPSQKSRCTSTTTSADLDIRSPFRAIPLRLVIIHQDQSDKNKTHRPHPRQIFPAVAFLRQAKLEPARPPGHYAEIRKRSGAYLAKHLLFYIPNPPHCG